MLHLNLIERKPRFDRLFCLDNLFGQFRGNNPYFFQKIKIQSLIFGKTHIFKISIFPKFVIWKTDLIFGWKIGVFLPHCALFNKLGFFYQSGFSCYVIVVSYKTSLETKLEKETCWEPFFCFLRCFSWQSPGLRLLVSFRNILNEIRALNIFL